MAMDVLAALANDLTRFIQTADDNFQSGQHGNEWLISAHEHRGEI